jgi:hypothetical protein
MIPCKWYGPFYVDLWNAGQCDFSSSAFIHFKNFWCWNADPKAGSGYPDPFTGDLKPEPELVAEYGGQVNCTWVDGVGVMGDDCTLAEHIEVMVMDEAGNILVMGKMADLECKEFYLFEMWPCDPREISLWFHLQQPSEEDMGYPDTFIHPDDMTPIPEGEDYNIALMHWLKWNDWPSWALMKDVIYFEMEFDLWLIDP